MNNWQAAVHISHCTYLQNKMTMDNCVIIILSSQAQPCPPPPHHPHQNNCVTIISTPGGAVERGLGGWTPPPTLYRPLSSSWRSICSCPCGNCPLPETDTLGTIHDTFNNHWESSSRSVISAETKHYGCHSHSVCRRWKYRSDKERIFTKFLAHADSDILKVRRQRVNRQYTRAPQQPSATPDPLASPLLSLSPSLNNMPCPTPMQKRRLVAFADGSTCGRISEKDKHEAQPGVLVGSAVRAILGLRSMDDSACHSDVPWS